jgi:chorismate synthase
MSDIGFAPNYTNLHELEIPDQGFVRIGSGITSITPNGNEQTDQTTYYDGDGLASTNVSGGQLVLSFTGNRRYGDAAQDYIAGLQLEYGAARKTRYRHTAPDGQVILATDATVANISSGGGDASSKGDFSFEIHINGRPELTAGNASTFPEAISAASVTVSSVGANTSVVSTVTPPTASRALAYAIADSDIASVSSDGIVTGLRPGQTELSIKSVVKPSVVTVITVTVSGV